MNLNYIHVGDARDILHTIPDASVDCCVTSPPYYGLRDYGHDLQIGLETDLQTYLSNIIAIFREVRRILKNDGTLWLNLGDSYAGNGAAYGETKSTLQGAKQSQRMGAARKTKTGIGLKPKDLIGIPWRVALALQAEGWYLRQDIIWHKPNSMPESVTDRCTKVHEYIFLLTKSPKYYFDAYAIKQDIQPSTLKDNRLSDENYTAGRRQIGYPGNPQQCSGLLKPNGEKVNRRSVWTIATKPYQEAHFATFPVEIPRLCIAAGCPEGGIVLDPFFGSGTTGLAALQLNRQYIGIEINPQYIILAKKRLAQIPEKNLFNTP